MTDLASRLLDSLKPWQSSPSWCIAFSGGLDSSVLLHLLASLSRQHKLPPVRALHIHHGLQPVADTWPDHCRALCGRLGIALQVIPVQVAPGASLEQAARDARYAAFAEALKPGEILLTGQHREDQAETLLFRLLRGAGLRGLGAMPGSRPLGQGALVRPLLGVSRDELSSYAMAQGLDWIEDPSNADTRFSRNYLRHQVMPALQQRWPQVARSLARSAEHLGEAQGLLDELAEQDLAQAASSTPWPWLDLPSLNLQAMRALSPARQRNALQYWLASRTRLPDARHWSGWDALRDAAPDGRPLWCLADGELHRSGERVFWLSGPWLGAQPAAQAWDNPAQPLALDGNGRVELSGTLTQHAVQVRYRTGGEILALPGRGHRDLKRLLNEQQLPLFVRARLPLLFQGDTLLAVANLPELSLAGCQLHWCVPTSAQGLR
ncbi:tRNA lysidine(34) synthetase TilS [Pseudomonas fontis]|uniref:tRNA(Ile)-lysidine synthase n=1 Tax=Pseudomonas fontis TaxID=2942633 RepID=A0ABT5NPN9_9PSED|nr:tRNA lysidine(34) synthetase TilS [Pseudomonas fontis]MDD0972400.1 tRNA lysidine(34) synthetase TilS [Pseudomonas fontis]MDD0990143.1 tRNA lysidine(34) synthetase TilS [Pseudomonas fontis]